MAVLRNEQQQRKQLSSSCYPVAAFQPLEQHPLPGDHHHHPEQPPHTHHEQTEGDAPEHHHQHDEQLEESHQPEPQDSHVSQRSRRGASAAPQSTLSSLMFLILLLLYSLTLASSAPSPDNGGPASNSVGSAPGSGEVALPMKDSNWLKGYEPSCDELRAMWRFSKRQSRASEITNEIPTFRGDPSPFALNLWPAVNKPLLSKQRSGLMLKGRNPARMMYDRAGRLMNRNLVRNGFPQFLGLGPVYGRVLHKEPEPLDFGYPVQPPQQSRRVQYRFPGPSPGSSPPANAVVARMSGGTQLNVTPQRGSFLKLKELVWTERARELAQQRKNEEMQARAAVLKELANGGHGMSYQTGGQDSYYPGVGNQDYNNGENQEDESAYYDGSSMNGGGGGSVGGGSSKLSHFRERNSFLQQQQQQQQREQPQMSGNSKINFPSKHSRLY